jgi:hypothetical protein
LAALRAAANNDGGGVGGEVVIHLHGIVDAVALLGRDFAPTPAELRRARRTKGDRFFWFDEVPDNAVYDGKFNAPMLWNSNFFMTPESMKILRVLTDAWLPDFKFGPRHLDRPADSRHCAERLYPQSRRALGC